MNKVDLFIPTFNRPEFLQRLLNYYQNSKVNYRIIVVDSSTPANKKINKRLILRFKKLDIKYVDEFPSSMVSHIKFGKMLKYAKSEFTVFCADDDFVVPKGIDDSVKFLEQHPDYIAAHGSYIAFYIYKGLLGNSKFIWRYIYSIKTINSESSLDRVMYHIENYNQVLWAVRRTSKLREVYSEFLKSMTDPILFGELLPDILTLAFGKVKRINTFYSARQAFSTAYSYWPSLQDAIEEGRYEDEYRKFKNCLARNIVRNQPESKKQEVKVIKSIDASMVKYLSLSRQEHLMGRINLLLQRFPNILSGAIRKMHINYLYSKKNTNKIGDISFLNSKYYNDFKGIKRAVLE